MHLGNRHDGRAVDALVALEDVLEEAARPELGDSQVERAHTCLEAAVPVLSQNLCLWLFQILGQGPPAFGGYPSARLHQHFRRDHLCAA